LSLEDFFKEAFSTQRVFYRIKMIPTTIYRLTRAKAKNNDENSLNRRREDEGDDFESLERRKKNPSANARHLTIMSSTTRDKSLRNLEIPSEER